MKPNARRVAKRIHRYMSSPDYEGGDGPATALGNIEAAIRAEYADLQAIVDKLPKTKDGVSVVPRLDDVWHRDELYRDELVRGVAADEDDAEFDSPGDGDWHYHSICECYSTREAAKAGRDDEQAS